MDTQNNIKKGPEEMNNHPKENPKDSLLDTIWQTRYWYSGIFLLVAISGEIIVITREITQNQGIINTWLAILEHNQGILAAAITAATTLTEGARFIMVIAHGVKQIIDKWLDKKDKEFRDKLRAEGRAEERAALNKAWQDWLARKEDAESRGQPFNEPPPNANPE